MAYDSTNRRLYIDTENGIGITLEEIALCIQDYRVDTNGNKDTGMLCSSPMINPWAKNKTTPYHNAGGPYIGLLTYEMRASANFGLNIPESASPLLVKEEYYDAGGRWNGWTHNVPDPYYNDYFRITDFDNYYHNSQPPFGAVSVPAEAINMEGSTFSAMMTVVAGGVINDEAISQSELPGISDKYFAIQVRQKDGSSVRTTTSGVTLGEAGGDIEMSTFNLPDGEYDVIPFISPSQYTDYDGEILTDTYHPLPLGKATVITIYDRWYTITLSAYKTTTSAGDNAIAYSFTVKNNSAAPIEFSGNFMEVKFRTSNFEDALLDGEKRQILFAFTVPASGTYTYPESTITGMSQAVYDDPQLWFSFRDGVDVESIIPLASAGDKE